MKRCLVCDSVYDAPEWVCPACGARPTDDPFLRFSDADGSDQFPRSAFESLARAEDSSFWFRARNAILLTAIRRHFPDLNSFFELGCGNGFVLRAIREAFPKAQLVGGELAIEGLEVARARVPDASLIQVDGRQLPYRDEFDVVGTFDVLEHTDDEPVLAELAAAVKPGGGLVLTVPQHPWLWSAADEFGQHKRRYTRRELITKLRAHRLEVTQVTSFMTLLLPLMAVSRFRQRDIETFDPDKEFRLPRRVDRALERIARAERHAVRFGVSLPAGGSLLAVARRS